MTRTALFIDGPNLYATGKALRIDVDFKRLLKHYGDGLVRAYYYTAVIEDKEEYISIKPLIDWLVYNGYTLVTKPAKQFHDPLTGLTKVKGNMDMDIAVDMFEISQHINHLVLFSGDGDFVPLLHAMQRRGIRTDVVSSIQTQPSMCADELRRAADTFTDLTDLEGQIARAREDRPAIKPRSRYG